MNDTLIALIARLNEVIARETALLEELDLRRAGALVGEKLSAQKALQAACMAAAQERASSGGGEQDDALRGAIRQLDRLSAANRGALERGLTLQMRLIQTIATAVPRARAAQAPIYQPNGSQLPPRPPAAFAFLSRM